MNWLLSIYAIVLIMNPCIFDFDTTTDSVVWQVVNDGVMGGRSESRFSINAEGHGCFQGTVSLANNGGFASVRHRFKTKAIGSYSEFRIRLKGDGKAYRFRVKATPDQQYSYSTELQTSGEWETVTIAFAQMVPTFRGRLLDLPNYAGTTMAEIAFLIGNKKAESFALEIDNICLH